MTASAVNSISSASRRALPPTVTDASALRTPSPVSEIAAARSWIRPPSLTSTSGCEAPVLTAAPMPCRSPLASRAPAGTNSVPVTSMALACTRMPLRAFTVPCSSTVLSVSCPGVSVPYIKASRLSPAPRMSLAVARLAVATDSEPTLSTPPLPTTRPSGATKNTLPPTALVDSSTLLRLPLMYARASVTRLTRLCTCC